VLVVVAWVLVLVLVFGVPITSLVPVDGSVVLKNVGAGMVGMGVVAVHSLHAAGQLERTASISSAEYP
jgi:hypothetical protein